MSVTSTSYFVVSCSSAATWVASLSAMFVNGRISPSAAMTFR